MKSKYIWGAQIVKAVLLVLIGLMLVSPVFGQEDSLVPNGRVVDQEQSQEEKQIHPKEPRAETDQKEDEDGKVATEEVLPKPLILILHGKSIYTVPEQVPERMFKLAGPEFRDQLIKDWSRFIVHLKSGGKWTMCSLGRPGKKLQTVIDIQGLEVIKRSKASGPEGERYLPFDKHPDSAHGHLGIFEVKLGEYHRDKDHVSNLWHCEMPYALRYFGGHFIHAALPNVCWQLGDPASHGCTRNEPAYAEWRFQWVGDQVYFVLVMDDQELAQALNLEKGK